MAVIALAVAVPASATAAMSASARGSTMIRPAAPPWNHTVTGVTGRAGVHAYAARVPGEVVVTYARSTSAAARARVQRRAHAHRTEIVTARTRVLRLKGGASVNATVRTLRADPRVASAAPNPIAHAAGGYIPTDPGDSGQIGGWQALQWNFDGPYGVDAPDAWSNLMRAGRPGGRGVTVAVLDTGVAYANHGRYRRSPDFRASHFVAPYDFVDHDSHPDDENGHGTHVTGTINEATANGVALTGLAYGARIMPVRVLDRYGDGDSVAISRGIRYAVRHHADVINLSFEFDMSTSRRDVPDLLAALQEAHRRGVLVVGASGNEGGSALAFPARAPSVLSVGASTEHGCAADYSNGGASLDLVAPGGGADADLPGDPHCSPNAPGGRNIFQLTFSRSVSSFGIPRDYAGTSMATPHVSATAALVIASGVLGPHPSPDAVERRLKTTARPLGSVRHYGAGLLDAAAATTP